MTKRTSTFTVLAVAVLLVLLLVLPVVVACTPRSEILRVLTFGDYICRDLMTEFEEHYQALTGRRIQVRIDEVSENEDMYNRIAINRRDYDIMTPSEYMAERLLAHDRLLPIMTEAEIRNAVAALWQENEGEPTVTFNSQLHHLSPFITNKMATEIGSVGGRAFSNYFVPYMWGTMGILYNPALLRTAGVDPAEMRSWNAIFAPSPALAPLPFYMKDSMRDAYAMAAIWTFRNQLTPQYNPATGTLGNISDSVFNVMNIGLGMTADAARPQIDQVTATLVNQRTASWDNETAKITLSSGVGAVMSMNWSGSSVYSKYLGALNGVRLNYVVPDEGTNIWVDGFVIPETARNTLAANLWIHFMTKPSSAMASMFAVFYTSAVSGYNNEIADFMDDFAEWLDYEFGDLSWLVDGQDMSYFFGKPDGTIVRRVCPTMWPSKDIVWRSAIMRDFGPLQDIIISGWRETQLART